MDENKIKQEIQDILKDKLNVIVDDPNENFFNSKINISPIDMIYLTYELGKKFQVEINDTFIENLPVITLNNLVKAFSTC